MTEIIGQIGGTSKKWKQERGEYFGCVYVCVRVCVYVCIFVAPFGGFASLASLPFLLLTKMQPASSPDITVILVSFFDQGWMRFPCTTNNKVRMPLVVVAIVVVIIAAIVVVNPNPPMLMGPQKRTTGDTPTMPPYAATTRQSKHFRKD